MGSRSPSLCVTTLAQSWQVCTDGHWAGCLKVSDLWVCENERCRGQGSELLEAAEDGARARGCRRAILDTHSFQAPAFYQKRGYRIVSTMEDFPPGHRTYTLVKDL